MEMKKKVQSLRNKIYFTASSAIAELIIKRTIFLGAASMTREVKNMLFLDIHFNSYENVK
jgi:hypothetical protein